MATLTIISGNGQLVAPGFPTEPLVVELTSGGSPVVGATVTWALSGPGDLTYETSVTGDDGRASTAFVGDAMITIATSWETSVITASATGASSVSFYATTTTVSAGGFAVFPTPTLVRPSISTGWSGNPSSTLAGALQLQLKAVSGTMSGKNVPNVGVWIEGGVVGSTPTARLPGGLVFTTDSGLVSDVEFGSVEGAMTTMTLCIGGFAQYTIPLLVTSDATSATAGSGNYQSAFIGQPFEFPITVEVRASDGSPAVGETVVWTVVTPSSLTITASDAVTDSRGWADASVTAGATAGEYTITAEALGKTATFHLVVTDPLSVVRVSTYSGYGQSAKVGTAFANPLVVIVTDLAAQPVPGVTVSFSVASGSVTIDTYTAETDDSGKAQTNATAGLSAGAARVTASITGSACTFGLTVLADYVPPPGGDPGGGAAPGGGGIYGGADNQLASLRLTGLLSVAVYTPPVPAETEEEHPAPDYTTYPACLESYDKHPADVLDLTIHWDGWLGGDAIVSSVWDDGELSHSGEESTDTATTIKGVSGGASGMSYLLANTITTQNGRVETRRLRVCVRELDDVSPIQAGWVRGGT